MFSKKLQYRLFLKVCIFLLFPCINSLPVPATKNLYIEFIDSLINKNCVMPKEIFLPFDVIKDPLHFGYLAGPLSQCQTPEALKDYEEAHLLCKETFEVLRDITCSKRNASIPEFKTARDFHNVCKEFASMKDILPKKDDNLSGRLVDNIVCKLLCSEKFKSLCQTLLWSYDVQIRLNQIEEAYQNPATEIKVTSEIHDPVLDIKDIQNGKNIPQEPVFGKENGNEKDAAAENVENNLNSGLYSNIAHETPVYLKSNNTADINKVNFVNDTLQVPDTKLPSIFQTRVVLPNKTLSKKKNPHDTVKEIPTTINEIHDNAVKINKEDSDKPPDKTKINESLESLKIATVMPSNSGDTNANISNAVVNSKNNDGGEQQLDNDNKNNVANNNYKPNHVPDFKSKNIQTNDGTEGKPDVPQINKPDNNERNAENIDDTKADTDIIPPQKPETNQHMVVNNGETETQPNKLEENELDGGNFEEKTKNSEMEDGLPLPETSSPEKNVKKTKEIADNVPEKITVVESIKLMSTTVQTVPDKNIEDPDDRDAEQYYNDTENEDYPKLEYENTLNELKMQKPVVKSSVVSEVVNPNDDLMQNNYDMLLSRNNFGRGQDTVIAPFPEQEDGHFFFYFLSVVLILMAGYLLVHNKQKIIALIVEGRHERRRRSHGAGYKKLDTK